MDVSEVKSRARQLEQDIYNLISKFEKDTGANVGDVSLRTLHTSDGKQSVWNVEVKVSL